MRHQICSYYALLLHFQLRLVMQLLQLLLLLLLGSFLLTRTPLRLPLSGLTLLCTRECFEGYINAALAAPICEDISSSNCRLSTVDCRLAANMLTATEL